MMTPAGLRHDQGLANGMAVMVESAATIRQTEASSSFPDGQPLSNLLIYQINGRSLLDKANNDHRCRKCRHADYDSDGKQRRGFR
jgi:hypothetical protein